MKPLNFKPKFVLFLTIIVMFFSGCSVSKDKPCIVGAAQPEKYLPLIAGKKVGVVVNQTSVIDSVHLVDFLLQQKVNLKAIYAPEHGYKGNVERGQDIDSSSDSITGIQIFSIYGSTRKPTPEFLKGIDVVIFDIQDVGCRFYTVLSTLHYVMEACAENHIPVIVFDRPNPIGHYIDGPVMKPEFSNFIGMHPVPVVYGMTLGEYAQMINGEAWLKDQIKCELTVIKLANYTHQTMYKLPVNPSPNIVDMKSVYLYPSICFFEGAAVNEGRGTYKPFQQIGAPYYTPQNHSYVPKPIPVLSLHPTFENQTCYGYDFSGMEIAELQKIKQVNLQYLIEFYQKSPDKQNYFNSFFENLAGSDTLRKQIIAGLTEQEIRESWQADIEKFKQIRKKYLLYAE